MFSREQSLYKNSSAFGHVCHRLMTDDILVSTSVHNCLPFVFYSFLYWTALIFSFSSYCWSHLTLINWMRWANDTFASQWCIGKCSRSCSILCRGLVWWVKNNIWMKRHHKRTIFLKSLTWPVCFFFFDRCYEHMRRVLRWVSFTWQQWAKHHQSFLCILFFPL